MRETTGRSGAGSGGEWTRRWLVLAVVALTASGVVVMAPSPASSEPFPQVGIPARIVPTMGVSGTFRPGGSVSLSLRPPAPACSNAYQTGCYNELEITRSPACLVVNHSAPEGVVCQWGAQFEYPRNQSWPSYYPPLFGGNCTGARFDYTFVNGGPNGTDKQWPGAANRALSCTFTIAERMARPDALQGPTWQYIFGDFSICEVVTDGVCTQHRVERTFGLAWLEGDADANYLGPEPTCGVEQSGPGGATLRFVGGARAGRGGYFREWTFSDGTTTNNSTWTINATQPGVYSGTWRTWTADGRIDRSVTCSATVGVTQNPVAKFSYEATDGNPREIAFTNLSTHPDSLPMTYEWTFEEGVTSTEVNPTHTFPSAGTYPVTLRATDSAGKSDLVTSEVVVEDAGLVVNSTADLAAIDVAERGCDTGRLVDDEPECTLRAAIQAANEEGGGEITFDIPGGGVPTIAPAENLPELSTSITVDGTSQDGGFVKVDGGSTLTRGLVLTDGTSRVTGMVLDGFVEGFPLLLQGGTGHIIEGNRVGTTVDGNGLGTVRFGVTAIDVADVEVRDNVLHCLATCISVSGASGSVVADNSISVGADGVAFRGRTPTGVLITGTNAEVTDNQVNAATVGILVRDAGADGSMIRGNFVGTTRAGAGALGPDDGIRIDGAPGVTVTQNVVTARGNGGILVTGKQQITSSGELLGPTDDVRDGPVTGGRAQISDNLIGVLSDGTTAGDGSSADGVVVWADAADVSIRSNVIANQRRAGVLLRGGSGHVVSGNALGTDRSGSADLPQGFGVRIEDATGVVVGGSGQGNTIRASDQGVTLTDGTVGARVIGNDIADTLVGIGTPGAVDEDAELAIANTTITANTIEASSVGVNLAGTVDVAAVSDNTIEGGELAGVLVDAGANGIDVRRNTILGAARGVINRSPGTTIEANRIGISAGGTVSGSALAGIAVTADATVTDNVIVGSGDFGVVVGPDAIGRMEGNEIHQTAGVPIQTESGPEAPEVTAAIREADEDRTLLIVTGLPAGEAGTLEVFSNDDCSDPEARYVLDLTERTRPGRTWAIVPLLGRGDRDDFTVTYTSPTDGTSGLSSCEGRATYPDGDGDGTVDPTEALVGTDADPTRAVLVTDDGDLLLVDAADGQLRDVGFVEDPDPDGNLTLAYGAIGFRVVGLEAGAGTTVNVGVIDGPSTGGDAYWKYGSPSPGTPATWYRFDPDGDTATGAQEVTVDYGGAIGLRRMWALALVDGMRGDDDGAANGTILDPGGPGTGTGTGGTPPTPTPLPPDPSGGPDPTDGDGSPTDIPVADRPAPAPVSRGSLPRTGQETGGLVATALALVLAGTAIVRSRQRTRVRAR